MSNAIKVGARIRMNQDYGSTANKGDMGTVRELRNGFTGIDFDNGQSHTGVCNSRFYVVNDTSTAHVFKAGDRVEALEDYAAVRAGTKGTVDMNDATGYSEPMLRVRFDGHSPLFSLFARRCKPATPVTAETMSALKASPKPYVFKVGDKGLTRAGVSYEIIMRRTKPTQPLIAEVTHKDGEITVESYGADGSYYENSVGNAEDLLPPPKTVTIYLNVKANGMVSGSYTTAADAKRFASSLAVVKAHPVTIELP